MPTTLAIGDIALVGYASDTTAGPAGSAPKSFAFVLLRDVDAGTAINFTDNGWLAAGGFRAGEGVVTWTAPGAGAVAGTVITVTGLTGTLNPSVSGDQIIAFQGTLAVPTPLFAVDFADGNGTFAADATNSNTSAIPAGLTAGSTALAFGTDNAAYAGPTTGSAADLLAAIANSANWTTNDAAPVAYANSFTLSSQAISVSVSDASVTEGDSGLQSLTFTVTRTGAADPFSVNYASADGSATAGADYAAVSGALSFAAGEMSKTVTVTVTGDIAFEADETVLLNLSSPTSGVTLGEAQGVGAILNDDAAPAQSVSIAATSADKPEGDAGPTAFTFTVSRSGAVGAGSVEWTVSGLGGAGQATASDFQATAGTVSFQDGQTAVTLTVQVTGDVVVEADETFSVTLSNPTGGLVLGAATSDGVIRNDDAPPPVTGTPWINEFHYDNASTDVNEFVEIAGPAGFSLTGYSLVLYNGNGGGTYGTTLNLTGVIPGQQGGAGVISFAYPRDGLQNGSPDGIALVGPSGVVEFISYEGVMVATGGPAAGLTSLDVGVSESGTALGTSIARVGEGGEGADFTWVLANDDSPGAPNPGQTLVPATARVRVSDASVVEGDSGTQTLIFTVTRSGPGQAFSVDYATADGTATSGSDYVAVSGILNFAAGETSKTVSVTVNGDTAVEPFDTLFLNLSAPTNGATLGDAQGLGRILNDDIAFVRTFEIQGAGHVSPYDGQQVVTEGVVTAVDTNGFWIQDPTGDGNTATSDAVFVFTAAAPTAQAGQLVRVSGTVDEFNGGQSNNLPITQIVAPTVSVIGTGTITPTVLGAGGRQPPTEVIDNDQQTIFDPEQDGLDFYESLEGMLVTIPNARATDVTDGGATWVVSEAGAGATGLNDRGGITISAGDFNPERILVYADSGVNPGFRPAYVMGDSLGDVTGVVSYFGGQYEVIATQVGNTVSGGPPAEEITTLVGDATHLTLAAYNVENLDPTDPASKFAALAQDIVTNLKAPDILGLEEIQDADGAGGGANLSGGPTLQKLIDAIVLAGGPRYAYVEVAPDMPNTTGGEPGGNIRGAFLYNPDRVQYVEGSARLITDIDPANGDAFLNSREPLAADFVFRGETITAIDVHNTSRGGSESLFGANQPPENAGDVKRFDQGGAVRDFVEALTTANPGRHVAVMGDFNAFQFESSVVQLELGGLLTNLTRLLPANEQYTYVFQGNSQQLDHLLVSPGLTQGAAFDIVHLNTGVVARPTDHDPVLARVLVNTAPVAVNDTGAVNEDGVVTLNVAANDTDVNTGDVRTLVSVSASGSGAAVSIVDGQVVYAADAAAFDALASGQTAVDTFSYTVRDLAGAESSATVSVTVTGVNDAPVTAPVTGFATEGAAAVTLDALANATDADAGAVLTVIGVSATLPAGVSYDTATQLFRLDPTAGAYDGLRAGQTQVVAVSYSVTDGAASTAQTASWTVTGTNDGPTAVADQAQVNENQSVIIDVLANDTDADIGDAKSIVSVSGTALGGSVSIVDGKLVYAADADAFDLLSAGQGVTDSFTYTLADDAGASSTASVSVAVLGVANGATQKGGNGNSTLTGTAADEVLEGGNGSDRLAGLDGADTLLGGNGSDTLTGGQGIDSLSGGNGGDSLDGGAGADHLSGGNGDDVLVGGAGSDVLSGGNGGDRFVFTGPFGRDVVTDFDKGNDRIELDDAQFADFAAVLGRATQVGDSVVITLDAENSLTLSGLKLASLGAGDFLFT